jgi:integrase/recombinase XerD
MARRTRYRPTDGFVPLAFWPTADSAPVPVQASRFPFIHSAPVSVAFTTSDLGQPHDTRSSQPASASPVVFVPAPVPAGGIDGMDRATRQAFLRVTTDPDDALIIRTWLHGKAPPTVRGYVRYLDRFLSVTGNALRDATISDLQSFEGTLVGMEPGSRVFALNAVRSVLSFGYRTGELLRDVGQAMKVRPPRHDLAARIMTPAQMKQLLSMVTIPRNAVLARLAYASGMRVTELVSLTWGDLHDRPDGSGQVTVRGKGGYLWHVHVPVEVWSQVRSLPDLPVPADGGGSHGDNSPRSGPPQRLPDGSLNPVAPLFRVDRGTALGAKQAYNILRAAGVAAGIPGSVSPHWFRHCHASHAAAAGAPIHLISAQLGHRSIATTMRYLHAQPETGSGSFLDLG